MELHIIEVRQKGPALLHKCIPLQQKGEQHYLERLEYSSVLPTLISGFFGEKKHQVFFGQHRTRKNGSVS